MDKSPVSTHRAWPRGLLRACLISFFAFTWALVHGQVDNVMVYGTVKDMSTAKKLDGVTVTVFKNGAKLVEVTTNASGKYEVNLDYGADFKVMCSKPGYVGKNINIDTRNVPEEERQGGHGMNIDFTMMVEIEGVDYSILNEPFGKAKYVGASGNFEWDMDYTARMRDAQARLLKEYEDRKKREASAEADFAKAMEEGNKAMGAKDYKKAVDSYTKAVGIKSADPVANAKLSDARMALEAQNAEKQSAEKYAALIKEADGLFGKKDYEGAKSKYNAALDIKEGEAYPKQKIKEIDAILADLAKKAEEEKKAKELTEKYNAAIAAGDAAFKASNWDQAAAKYTEASDLKPEEKYPKDQLAAVAKKKEEAARKAEEERLAKELKERYDAAIAAADAAFKTNKWDDATAKYTEASGLKPEEKYPKDQLAAIAKKKEEAAKKAEEERQAKELQDKYDAAVRAGDQAFQAVQLDAAESSYKEASALKPGEKYPKDQLAAIQRKRDELDKQAAEERRKKEIDEQYQALLAEGAQAFTGERYDEAIAKYTAASELKPAEKYPKDQIAAIRKKQDDLAKAAEEARKQKELDDRYQAAISAADAAFNAGNWAEAKARYTEAGGVKPAEKYPKDQLVLVAKKEAEEAARKEQEEIDARYNAAIDAADAAFNAKDLQAARAKYEEARGIKPKENYPPERIKAVDDLIAEEKRKAEEERKRQELEQRYADLVARADAAFGKEQWSAALNDYKDASALKPNEAHPKERIAAIEQKLDAAAQAKAEEERLAREKQERDARYNDLVAAADKAFNAKKYDEARTKYGDAAGVKPEESYPKDKLAEIERILADQAAKAEADRLAAEAAEAERLRRLEQERLAAEAAEAERLRKSEADRLAAEAAEAERLRRLEEERLAAERARMDEAERLRREAEAEAERLAEERRRAEEEKRRKEEEEARARMDAAEQARLAREAEKAAEELYRALIAEGDEAFATKDLVVARSRFSQANDLRPSDPYPVTMLERIDKQIAEEERRRQEAELAAQRVVEAPRPEKRTSTTVDAGKEEEAERFMREAREQEEREKYERIKKLRADHEAAIAQAANSAQERRDQGVREKAGFEESAAGLFAGDESRRVRNAAEVEAYKQALAEEEERRVERSGRERDDNYQAKQAFEQQHADRERSHVERQVEAAEANVAFKEQQAARQAELIAKGLAANARSREQAEQQAAAASAMAAKGNDQVEANRRAIEQQKEALERQELVRQAASADARARNKEQIDALPKAGTRAFADYNRSKLAQDYPPGVTEESYTEGNKVIIRRVVVNGNKADDYSKVIAKWGTFYFKNGQSISEHTWSQETAN